MSSSPLSIGFVANTFAPVPGGMECYLDHLSSALAAEGHDVRVVTRFVEERPTPLRRLFRAAETPRIYQKDDVTVHVVAPTAARRVLLRPTYRLHHHEATQRLAIDLFARAFEPVLRTALRGCDVIHFSGTGREMLGFVAAQVAREYQVPFVVTPHMHVGSWGDGAFDFRLYRQADTVIALTEYEQSVLIENGIDPARVFVQGHGVNVAGTGDGTALRDTLGIGETPFVLFLGRKSSYKGFPLLLEAAPSVWAHHPDTRFVFAGPSDSTLTLSSTAKTILTDARIIDLGFVSDQTRENLYAACDVFCLPSEAEAFGLVYVEAGFYGKPVVALDIPTLRELIASTERGLLAERSVPSIADALLHLLSDPELQRRLGANGRRAAAAQTWSHVAQRMTDRYATERHGERVPASSSLL